jgi:hypothetical protein
MISTVGDTWYPRLLLNSWLKVVVKLSIITKLGITGFRRLSIGIMWYVEVMVRGIFIQRPMLRDVVVAGVGCVLCVHSVYCNSCCQRADRHLLKLGSSNKKLSRPVLLYRETQMVDPWLVPQLYFSMDRSWKHSSIQRALGTDDTAGWRVRQVNIRPWLCWAVNRQNTGITKVLLWTGLEALWARLWWCFSWKESEGQKKRDNMSLTSTHISKRIQSSWLLGVLPSPHTRFHNLEIRDGEVSIYIVASLPLLVGGRWGEGSIFPTESDVRCCRGSQTQHMSFCCIIDNERFLAIIIVVPKHQNQATCDGKGT